MAASPAAAPFSVLEHQQISIAIIKLTIEYREYIFDLARDPYHSQAGVYPVAWGFPPPGCGLNLH